MLKKTCWFAFLLVFSMGVFAHAAEDDFKTITLPDPLEQVEVLGVSDEGIRLWNQTADEISLVDFKGNIRFTQKGALDAFAEGLAPYYLLFGAEGYLNEKGKFALPPIYEVAYPFSEGLAEAKMNGQSGIIDKSGRFVHFFRDGEYMTEFHDGVMWTVRFDEEGKTAYTLYDQSFKPLFETRSYDSIGPYHGGFAVAFHEAEGSWHVLDKKGEVRFSLPYEDPSQKSVSLLDTKFYGGRLLKLTASENSHVITAIELLNPSGKTLVSFSGEAGAFESVSAFGEAHYIAQTTDRKLLLLDQKLSEVSRIELSGWQISYHDENALLLLSDDQKTLKVLLAKKEEAPTKDLPEYQPLGFPEAPLSEVTLEIGKTTLTVGSETRQLVAAPVIKDGRTLVPVRALEEMMDCTVTWNARDKTVTLDGSKKVVLTIDQNTAEVTFFHLDTNKYKTESEPLDVAAEIIGDRTYIPLRFVAECFGYEVLWENGLVSLTPSSQSIETLYREFVKIYGTPKSN